MEGQEIGLLFLGETRSRIASKEIRNKSTWLFGGTADWEANVFYDLGFKPKRKLAAGMALVVCNKLLKFVTDIEPINGRTMSVTLDHSIPITIIGVYLPTADHQENIKGQRRPKVPVR